MTPSEPDSNPPASPKASGLSRVLKWLVVLAGFVLALVICVALLLTYWFPSELVREELEVRLSDMLDGTVRIRELSFNLLHGVSLHYVEFQQGPQPILELDRLVLDYSLFGLLQQKLKINEVRIDGADLSLNLAELQGASEEPQQEPDPPSTDPVSVPPIPLTLDLQSLIISRTNVQLDVSPELTVLLRDLNFELSGGVVDDLVRLKGELAVAQVGVDLEEQQLRFPLGLTFDVKTDLPSQQLTLDHVTVTSGPTLGFTLSGRVEEFLGNPKVDLTLDETQFDIKRVLALVEDFVPAEFHDVTVSGLLSPTLVVKGGLGEQGFIGTANIRIALQNFQTQLAQFETTLSLTNVDVNLTDVSIKDNVPNAGTLAVRIQSEKASFQVYEVAGLDFQLSGDYFSLGPVSAKMNVSGTANLPPQEPLAALTLPFAVQLDVLGNYRTQDATIKQFTAELGKLLNVKIEGSVSPNPGPHQIMDVDLKTRLEPHLEYILPLIPQQFLEDLTIEKLPAPDFITVNLLGRLDESFNPMDAEVSARVKVGNLTVTQNALSAGGSLDSMNFSLETRYNAQREDLRGTIAGSLSLLGIDYGDMAAVGHLGLGLDTSFSGRLSSSFELTGLVSEQAVNLLVRNIEYTSPELGVGLEELTLSANLREDIDAQHVTVKDLRVTSESLMDVQLAADFQQATQDFEVSLEIPYVNIGELQRKLSGELVQSLNELNPGGNLSLSVQASGRVPQEQDIQALDIPVALSTKLMLDNVSAAVANYQVDGAQGTVSFSLVPGDRPVVQVETDLTFAEVLLAPGMPLERLSGTFAKLNIMTNNFDEVVVKTLHVGTNGAEVSLDGSVGGIRKIIEAKRDVMGNLPDMFAQVDTTVRVNLDDFQALLKPTGLTGTGQAQVAFSLLKKERGLLALSLTLGSQGIQVSQEGIRVENVDGQILIRKRLNWIEQSGNKPQMRKFRPTDILSQLRSIAGKEKSLAIDFLDLGLITVSNFSANILFDQDAFKVQNLAMNLLNGGLGGNIIVTGGKAFGVAGGFEAAHLDLNQLLDDTQQISGDSLLDATIGLAVFFDQETGVLDLSRTEVKVFITHIGREAVDRLLMFLDPEGSNPTLVTARSQIKLANPSKVSVQLSRGMLSLEILFSEGVLSPFRLNRIPIGKVKQFKAVTKSIPDWDTVREIMALVGAQGYGVDGQGKLVLQ